MAGFRLGFLLLLAVAMVADSTSPSLRDFQLGIVAHAYIGDGGLLGHVGDFIDPEEETMMESESARRNLARTDNYISYAALRANNVPCGRRGHSYYDCRRTSQVNPYRRGCTAATRCARR